MSIFGTISHGNADFLVSLPADCSGVGTGRQEGLKIPWTEMSVRVRSPSGAPKIPADRLIGRDLIYIFLVRYCFGD